MTLDDRTAKDLMTRDVFTIAGDASLRQAAGLLDAHHVHCLVIRAADRCEGVITTKDLIEVLCEEEDEALDELRVRDVMTTPAFGVQQDASVRECLLLMRRAGVRSAPVLDGVRLVGLLSFTDVVRSVAARP